MCTIPVACPFPNTCNIFAQTHSPILPQLCCLFGNDCAELLNIPHFVAEKKKQQAISSAVDLDDCSVSTATGSISSAPIECSCLLIAGGNLADAAITVHYPLPASSL